MLITSPYVVQNEWVMCRIFKKTSGGKKEHISGLVGSRNDVVSQSSDLPPLTDLSSDEIHMRISHDTSLSNHGDKPFDEFSSSSSSMKHDFSPLVPFNLPQGSTPNSVFSSGVIPPAEGLSTDDSFLLQDQSVLRLLLEENVSNTTQNEVLKGVSYDEVGFKACYDQEFPFLSTATTDLDCLWDY